MAEVFLTHFLIPDESGPVKSTPVNTPTARYGTDRRHRVACDPSIIMTDVHRGTDQPYAVRCLKCQATEEFKKADRPKPGSVPVELSEQTPSPEERHAARQAAGR